ncbi:hypothetical protein [Streptomyces enissocaesilis]|uniref:Uncharacterized protein n=1 Tax=Streptomyces enissocaesilis TaxID=332589 RepID=A0ABP6JDH8_9ACTN
MSLPDRLPTYIGQPQPITEESADLEARRLIDDAYRPTSYRDPHPVPAIGTALPVPQPGRPPMSQKATDASALMLSAGAASLLLGGGTSLVMLASGHADPVVIAWICAAPAAIAVPILAFGRLLKAAGQASPPEHHHHYNGPVTQDQRSLTTTTRGVIANTRNQTR